MKCQFCNQRCRILKKGESDFTNHEMTWYCDKHPTRVLHHVAIERYALRRDSSIQGVFRRWNITTVSWVNEKGQMMCACYHRDYSGRPAGFIVLHIKRSSQHWDDKEVLELSEHPKDITPENIAKKIASYIAFS